MTDLLPLEEPIVTQKPAAKKDFFIIPYGLIFILLLVFVIDFILSIDIPKYGLADFLLIIYAGIFLIPTIALVILFYLITLKPKKACSIVFAVTSVALFFYAIHEVGITPNYIRFKIHEKEYLRDVATIPTPPNGINIKDLVGMTTPPSGKKKRSWDWGNVGFAGNSTFYTLVYNENDAPKPYDDGYDAMVDDSKGFKCISCRIEHLSGHFYLVSQFTD